MAKVSVLQQTTGGNPVFIDDLTGMSSLVQALANSLHTAKSWDGTDENSISSTVILSGFTLSNSNTQVSTDGYIRFNGQLYGFPSSITTAAVGTYLYAMQQNVTAVAEGGATYTKYVEYYLQASSTQLSTGTLIGVMDVPAILKWKNIIVGYNVGALNPYYNQSIPAGALANNSVAQGNIQDYAVGTAEIANNAVTPRTMGAPFPAYIFTKQTATSSLSTTYNSGRLGTVAVSDVSGQISVTWDNYPCCFIVQPSGNAVCIARKLNGDSLYSPAAGTINFEFIGSNGSPLSTTPPFVALIIPII